MKRLIIEQLKEGFIFTDETSEKYAVSSVSLSKRVSAYFGLTRHGSHKGRGTKNNIAPPVVTGKDARQCPETQGSKTPDSHSGGATHPEKCLCCMKPVGECDCFSKNFKSSSTEQLQQKQPANVLLQNEHRQTGNAPNTESKLGTPDNMVQRGQCAEILETPGFDSPAAPSNIILHPSDLKLPAFDYSGWSPAQYKSLSIYELPDGTVVLRYAASKYYTTKEKVMKIPYPFQKGYFSKENGWSSSVEQAFKMYRRHLFERGQEQQVEKERQEDPDDWKYKKILNTNTRANYDGNKIEGSLEV